MRLRLAAGLLAGALAGCGGAAAATPSAKAPVTVFAAASLTEPFSEMAAGFSAGNGGAKVMFNFAGSPALRTQLEQGAKADVFASANTEEMNKAQHSGLLEGQATVFARNKLAIITPKANPGGVFEPKDMAKAKTKLVVAAPEVPVGGYFLDSLNKMAADPAYGSGFKQHVLGNVISEETNVKQVVAKVQLGEADAGVVYTTDVGPTVAGDLAILIIPDQFNTIATYPIATLKGTAQAALARGFVDYVLSDAGQGALKKYNFITVG